MDPQFLFEGKIIGSGDSQLIVQDFLGKGTSSRCYKLKSCNSEAIYAGKFIDKSKLEQIVDRKIEEVRIHQSLSHKNIVAFYTFFEDKDYIYIIMEHCSNYTLAQMLERRKYLQNFEAKYFMLQIASAVEYLHKNRIMHRDLKLTNLFIDKNMDIKVGDFGLAAYIEYNGHKRYSVCGTPNYLSPEVLSRKGHSLAVDIWALGCILYTILVSHPPFQSSDTKTTCSKILRCEYTMPADMRASAKTFIVNTLQADPEKRPNINTLLMYEFLTSGLIPPKLPTSCLTLPPGKSEISKKTNYNSSDKKANRPSQAFKRRVGYVSDLDYQLKRLKSLLDYVTMWKVSTVGEVQGEDPSSSPLIWINSWVDYSKKYGFAYRLNDDNVGVLFNDHSCLIMLPAGKSLFYVHQDGTLRYLKIENIDTTLKKKYAILLHCRHYMFDSLRSAYDSSDDTEKLTSVPILMHYQRFQSYVMMILSNGILQINFIYDHKKLILSPIMETVTVVDNENNFKTIQLAALKKYGCSIDLMKRLSIVHFKLKQLLRLKARVTKM